MTAVLVAATLGAQDFSDLKIELLAKGYTFTEGPAWSKDGFLIFSDTPSDRLLKWIPGSDVTVYRADAHGPSGNAFDSQGRLYTCETRTRRVTRTERNGAVTVLADRWEGKRLNAPDEVAVSKTDQVYFTDPAFGSQADHRELDFYGIYHLPPHGPLKLLAKSASRPTGIALSPNAHTLYVADADHRAIHVYDLDRNGDPSGDRDLITAIDGVPLGIRADERGNLYVAAKKLTIYSPEGHLLHDFAVEGLPSNCGFGLSDGKTLFITARGNVFRLRLDGKAAN